MMDHVISVTVKVKVKKEEDGQKAEVEERNNPHEGEDQSTSNSKEASDNPTGLSRAAERPEDTAPNQQTTQCHINTPPKVPVRKPRGVQGVQGVLTPWAVFSALPVRTRRQLEMTLRTDRLPYGATLVRQGDPVIGLHFITKGQAQAVIEPGLHSHQYPRLWDQADSALARELGRNYFKKEERVKQSLQMTHIRVRRKEGYAAAERRLAEKRVPLCIVETGECIGDVEYVLGLETYHHTIVCTAATEVLIVDSKNVERLLLKKNPSALDIMRHQVEEKLSSRVNILHNSQIRILELFLNKLRDMNGKRDFPTKPMTAEKRKQDAMMKQLIKLFLQDKIPLITPCVPGSIFYRTKSCERTGKDLSVNDKQKTERSKSVSGELRLHRARWSPSRKPRSRRELERISFGHLPGSLAHESSSSQVMDPSPSPGRMSRSASLYEHGNEIHSTENIFKLTETPPVVSEAGQTSRPRSWTNGSLSKDALTQLLTNMEDSNDKKQTGRTRLVCDLVTQGLPDTLLRTRSAPAGQGHVDEDEEEEEEPVYDWETSEEALTDLESRIQAFHHRYDTEAGRPESRAEVAPLKRFHIQTIEDVPLAGGTVFVRQRPCLHPVGSSIDATNHQHVRRYVIPRNALEELGAHAHRNHLMRPYTAISPAGSMDMRPLLKARAKSAGNPAIRT